MPLMNWTVDPSKPHPGPKFAGRVVPSTVTSALVVELLITVRVPLGTGNAAMESTTVIPVPVTRPNTA